MMKTNQDRGGSSGLDGDREEGPWDGGEVKSRLDVLCT